MAPEGGSIARPSRGGAWRTPGGLGHQLSPTVGPSPGGHQGLALGNRLLVRRPRGCSVGVKVAVRLTPPHRGPRAACAKHFEHQAGSREPSSTFQQASGSWEEAYPELRTARLPKSSRTSVTSPQPPCSPLLLFSGSSEQGSPQSPRSLCAPQRSTERGLLGTRPHPGCL